jgi:hypothetical protein
VKVFRKTALREITATGVALTTDGREWEYPCDSVVLAFGATPYKPFSEQSLGKRDVVVIGDALKAGDALEAIHAGYFLEF